jgi:WD40 repeat protein
VKFELNPGFRCLASNGSRVAAGTRGGSIVEWNPKTLDESAAWTLGGAPVVALMARPGGRWLAADEEGTLWEAGRPVGTGPTHQFLASPDPSWFVTLGREALVLNEALDPIRAGPKLSERPHAAAISPGGTLVAIAGRRLTLWWLETGDCERRPLACSFVDFADPAHILLVQDEWIDLYDLETWTRRRSIRCPDGAVTCAWLDRAARRLFVGTDRGRVVPIDLEAGRAETPVPLDPVPVTALAPFDGGLAALQERGLVVLSTNPLSLRGSHDRHASGEIKAVELCPDRNLMATADERSVRLWNLDTGIQRARFACEQSLAAVSPDGLHVALADAGSIRLIDARSGDESRVEAGAGVSRLRFAPTGKLLGAMTTFDTLLLVSIAERAPFLLPGRYRAFAFSHPTGLLAAVTLDASLRVFDYLGRNQLFNRRVAEEALAVEFSSDESCVGVLDASGAVRTVALDSGRDVSLVRGPAPADQLRFAVGDGGKLIAVGTAWGDVQLFYDGQKLSEFRLERDLHRMVLRGDRLWCACVDASGSPARFADAVSFGVSVDALFAYKLSR